MIQPLRSCHRWSFLLLSAVLPVVFVAGILVRPQHPKPRSMARFMAAPGADWQKHSFVVQLSSSASGETSLELVPIKPVVGPDLLVYYANRAPQQGVLPPDAHLLGRWDAATTYPLPRISNGFVLVYSGAQKTVLDSVAVEGHP